MRRSMLIAVLLAFATAAPAVAQRRCVKGIPCGNTCIAASRTCRVGSGSATRAPASTAPRQSTAPAAAPTTIPDGAQFVASSRGRVYYYVGCSAWRTLTKSNLRWFQTAEEAAAAGYRPSASSGCAGPAGAESPDGSTAASAPGGRPVVPVSSGVCVVAAVTDGDTLDCNDGTRIRLLLIDAPELEQGPYGALAKAKLEELAPIGTELQVETDIQRNDRYGRMLAHLRRSDGVWLNQEMIGSGMAVIAVYPPNVDYATELRELANQARRERRGMWATQAFACEPADFRAGSCQ